MLDTMAYEPPRLLPLPFLAFSKHATRVITADSSLAPDLDVAALLSEHGSPLFVVSAHHLRRDYRDFSAAFSDLELDTRIAYSVKTNYLPAVCAILRQEGAWAEVVSGMEYELARSLGTPGAEIIFNGPHKTRDELEKAIGEDAIVNVDNFAELDLIQHVARATGRRARIGLRFSFHFSSQSWTKFGFSDDNGESQHALKKIAASPELDLLMLHNHCGTFVLDHDLYTRSAERMVRLAQRARKLGLSPRMADFGGGFPSRNTLKPEFDLPGGSRRTGDFWLPYGEILSRSLVEAKELFGGRPTLVLEPGRAVVDECTRLATTVVAKKRIPGQGDAIIIDAGVNLLPTACYYDHEMSVAVGRGRKRSRPVVVFGPLCMQTDILRYQTTLPDIDVGDHLLIDHVGAYCHTQSMQFIQPRPATVLIDGGRVELIRRREAWRDVFALDRLPDRLRPDGCTF